MESNKRDIRWNTHMTQLEEFYNKNGRFPSEYRENEKKLYRWRREQRRLYQEKKLRTDREKIILEKWPEFFESRREKNHLSDQVKEKIDYLKEYKEKNGTFPAAEYCDPEIGSIGIWLTHARFEKRQGKINKNKEKALDEIGFDWNPMGGTFDEVWNFRFEEIKLHHEETNDWPRPGVKRNYSRLYRWMQFQIGQYADGKLEKWKEDKLRGIGFPLNGLKRGIRSALPMEKWKERVEMIYQFKANNERFPKPKELIYDNMDLAVWYSKELHSLAKGETMYYTEEKKGILLKLGVLPGSDQCIMDIIFREKALLYKEYAERGVCIKDMPESICYWITSTRAQLKKGRLKPQKRKYLEENGIIIKKRRK